MRNILDDISGLGISLFMTAIGILFFFAHQISWAVLYTAVVAYMFLEPLRTLLLISSGCKRHDPLDTRLSLFNFISGVLLLMRPSFFRVYLYLAAGIWMLGSSFLSFVDAMVCRRDGVRGTAGHFIRGLCALLMGLFLLLGKAMRIKNIFLSAAAGIFFVFCGCRGLIGRIRLAWPDCWLARHTTWSLSLPLLLSAFYPLQACISLRSAGMETDSPVRPDLWVYFYLKDTGMEVFGHVDIAWKDVIYSYGCHDPGRRKLMGTLGDGVLIRSDREAFLRANAEIDHKTILGYGIMLSDAQKTAFEKKLQELMSRTVPWQCSAETAPEPSSENDYASRIWKSTGCDFFKFTGGRFRTYFVASTNCVLLADALIRSRELSLVTLSGFITPGSYLTFLNQEYILKNPMVPVRTVRHPAK